MQCHLKHPYLQINYDNALKLMYMYMIYTGANETGCEIK